MHFFLRTSSKPLPHSTCPVVTYIGGFPHQRLPWLEQNLGLLESQQRLSLSSMSHACQILSQQRSCRSSLNRRGWIAWWLIWRARGRASTCAEKVFNFDYCCIFFIAWLILHKYIYFLQPCSNCVQRRKQYWSPFTHFSLSCFHESFNVQSSSFRCIRPKVFVLFLQIMIVFSQMKWNLGIAANEDFMKLLKLPSTTGKALEDQAKRTGCRPTILVHIPGFDFSRYKHRLLHEEDHYSIIWVSQPKTWQLLNSSQACRCRYIPHAVPGRLQAGTGASLCEHDSCRLQHLLQTKRTLLRLSSCIRSSIVIVQNQINMRINTFHCRLRRKSRHSNRTVACLLGKRPPVPRKSFEILHPHSASTDLS